MKVRVLLRLSTRSRGGLRGTSPGKDYALHALCCGETDTSNLLFTRPRQSLEVPRQAAPETGTARLPSPASWPLPHSLRYRLCTELPPPEPGKHATPLDR